MPKTSHRPLSGVYALSALMLAALASAAPLAADTPPPGLKSPAIALWSQPEHAELPAGRDAIGLVAYHINGIERVGFRAGERLVAAVTNESVNPATGEMEFVCPGAALAATSGASLALTARVFPRSGRGAVTDVPARAFRPAGGAPARAWHILWGQATHLTVERCAFRYLDKAVAASPHAILRGNEIADLTSDAFNFGSGTLITGNRVHGLKAPRTYAMSGAAEPFDFAAGGELSLSHRETSAFHTYRVTLSGTTAQQVADALNAACRAQKPKDDFGLQAEAEAGRVKIACRRTNYTQHLYVGGSANRALRFACEGKERVLKGSGQHADVFQFGIGTGFCDLNRPGQFYADYNVYDYYRHSGGALAPHSINANPGRKNPTESHLFERVHFVEDGGRSARIP